MVCKDLGGIEMKEERFWKSMDQTNRIHVVIWLPEQTCKAVMILSHGMIEYVERYEPLAQYLNERGIAVIGNDHLGHGLSVKSDDDFGYIGRGKSEVLVKDIDKVVRYAKKRFGDGIPYILFGHSMGSFLARRYLMTYGKNVDAAILAGTAYHNPIELAFGLIVAKCAELVKGERYHSDFINGLAFGLYNRRIKNPRSPHDWISRDENVVDAYCSNKYCTFTFTINGYQSLFETLWFIQKKQNMIHLPKDMPILMLAGGQDPVGNYGAAVKKVCRQYKKLGVHNLQMKLYEQDRHELCNEPDKYDVYRDMYRWMKRYVL